MKMITRDTDYAIRALIFIARHTQDTLSVTDLVKRLKIPRPFLRKILQRLNKKRILKSYKGRGGGFLLARPAREIFLLDLIRIFQGAFKLNECFFKKKFCPNRDFCALRKKISLIENKVLAELKSITLASLLKD